MAQAPAKLSKMTEALTIEATTLLHQLASLDLNMFQVGRGGGSRNVDEDVKE